MIRASVVAAEGDSALLLFDVTFDNGSDLKAVVRRSLADIRTFNGKLQREIDPAGESAPDFPSDQNPSSGQLEACINQWLLLYYHNVSVFELFNSFMEDSMQQNQLSEVTRLQFNVLREKVHKFPDFFFSMICSSNHPF